MSSVCFISMLSNYILIKFLIKLFQLKIFYLNTKQRSLHNLIYKLSILLICLSLIEYSPTINLKCANSILIYSVIRSIIFKYTITDDFVNIKWQRKSALILTKSIKNGEKLKLPNEMKTFYRIVNISKI